jgi:hypothetical protein
LAVLLVLIGILPMRHGSPPRWWALSLAGVSVVVAAVRPGALGPLNGLSRRLGRLIHGIISLVLMAFIYYLLFTPLALVMRALGRDALRRRFDVSSGTYWILRETGGDETTDMRLQF